MVRKQKRVILVYCEGLHDHLFVQYLEQIFSNFGKRITLKKGQGGGLSWMIGKTARHSAEYDEKYVFLDLDTDKNKAECEDIAQKQNITLIWSDPCLEGLFLQILNGHSQMPDSQKCKSEFRNKYNAGQRKYDSIKWEKLFPKEKLVAKKEKVETLKKLIEIVNNIGGQKNL